ncbi:hypothetical protein RB6286 [Rhodopirellula baltica SH 1]|uniref:Uncharacterized protein n=1 Tax=Rhodopirellula baltica (strain DSM 10527 / NCIMB 13988 / SH1) TaxID=243090 RepID=Q7UQJ5_RHOBA|nr:hypothetical protein RB6286 [Rhodopirellula baltica SH 1]
MSWKSQRIENSPQTTGVRGVEDRSQGLLLVHNPPHAASSWWADRENARSAGFESAQSIDEPVFLPSPFESSDSDLSFRKRESIGYTGSQETTKTLRNSVTASFPTYLALTSHA